MSNSIFLKAEWRKLLFANYSIDPVLLKPYLPAHTEVELWNNTCYVSLVGFMFLNTKVKGIGFPFYKNFCEINLRFYVRHKKNGTWQRGVVFIREFVPRQLITLIANTFYNENYRSVAMDHLWQEDNNSIIVKYKWKSECWNSLEATTSKSPILLVSGSEEEFITEHYWGYTKLNDNKTVEYAVEHPKWDIYEVQRYSIDVDFGTAYGKEWGFLNKLKPASVFLAEGSHISVGDKRIIE